MRIRKKRRFDCEPLLTASNITHKTGGQSSVKMRNRYQNGNSTICTTVGPAAARPKTVPPPAAPLSNIKSSVSALASTFLKYFYTWKKFIYWYLSSRSKSFRTILRIKLSWDEKFKKCKKLIGPRGLLDISQSKESQKELPPSQDFLAGDFHSCQKLSLDLEELGPIESSVDSSNKFTDNNVEDVQDNSFTLAHDTLQTSLSVESSCQNKLIDELKILNKCSELLESSNEIRLKEGKFYYVKISHIEDGPAKFSVQLLKNLPYLDTMMNKINSKSQELLPLLLPIDGAMCLGPQLNHPLHRLCRVVLSSPGDIFSEVYFPDFGYRETLPHENLYQIPAEFTLEPTYSIEFTLSGIAHWKMTQEMKNFFLALVNNKSLKMKVCETQVSPPVQYCQLYLQNRSVKDMISKAFPEACNENASINCLTRESQKIQAVELDKCQAFPEKLLESQNSSPSTMCSDYSSWDEENDETDNIPLTVKYYKQQLPDEKEQELQFIRQREKCLKYFDKWNDVDQVKFIKQLLARTSHDRQRKKVKSLPESVKHMDFIYLLSKNGFGPLAEEILSYLDSDTLISAESVSTEWSEVIIQGWLWKKLIERKIQTDFVWYDLLVKRGWIGHFFQPRQGDSYLMHLFYRDLYLSMSRDLENKDYNWRNGLYNLRQMKCDSDDPKGVYCVQYDNHKIVSGQRNNSIKIWDSYNLECFKIITGHTGSVLCLQYDDHVIVSGSSDSTIRVWDAETGKLVNTVAHHSAAVISLKFGYGMLVTGSRDCSIAVWDVKSTTDIVLRKVLVGHRIAVNVVDFDEHYIVSGGGDSKIKVWRTSTCEFVRNLVGQKNGIACLQYSYGVVISGSSGNQIRLWDVDTGVCLRILEGHEKVVRCIKFNNKYIVSGDYNGKIKIWDLAAVLNPSSNDSDLCLQTLEEHTAPVFRLQFDEFQIVSSSSDGSIFIWDFLNCYQKNSFHTNSASSQNICGAFDNCNIGERPCIYD